MHTIKYGNRPGTNRTSNLTRMHHRRARMLHYHGSSSIGLVSVLLQLLLELLGLPMSDLDGVDPIVSLFQLDRTIPNVFP